MGTAETDETDFGGFVTMLPMYFWQSIPETPKQLDAVDAVDADVAPQGFATHGWRRPRRLRLVQLEFIIPRGMGPFAAVLSQDICLGNFWKFDKG